MKSLLHYLAYTLMFTCCSASQAFIFSDEDARVALLDLRSRVDYLKEKSVVSICSKNIAFNTTLEPTLVQKKTSGIPEVFRYIKSLILFVSSFFAFFTFFFTFFSFSFRQFHARFLFFQLLRC